MRKIPYFLPEYISTPHAPMPAAMPKQRAVGENCWTWCKVALLAIKKFPQCSSWFQRPFSSGGLYNRTQGTLCGQDCAVGFNFLVVWRHFRLVHHNKLKPRRSALRVGRQRYRNTGWAVFAGGLPDQRSLNLLDCRLVLLAIFEQATTPSSVRGDTTIDLNRICCISRLVLFAESDTARIIFLL